MKHSRNENIKNNVGTYLKGRHYSESENYKKSDLSLVRSSSQMLLSTSVEHESSLVNSIMYNCINNDPIITESQFSKLKSWIIDVKPDSCSEELKCLLFPLLCHLYIEMLRGGHKTAAANFLNRHQAISLESDSMTLLEELATIECTKDLENSKNSKYRKVLQMLRSSKYQVYLSTQSLELLKHYLITSSHVILLQVINCWFDLEETNSDCDLTFIDQLTQDNDIRSLCNGYREYSQHNDGDLARLEEVIRVVKEGTPSPAPLLSYNVYNTDNCATSARISHDNNILAVGFSTSDIKLWSVTEKKLKCSPTRKSRIPKIRLAIDLEPDEDEGIVKTVVPSSECVTLIGHSDCVQDVAFVPGTNYLMSVSMDNTMRAWDLDNFTCRSIYSGHLYPIWTLDVSNLGYYIATGSHDRTARLWSLERNYPLRIFAGHTQDVDSLKFHPNDSYLATGSSDKSVRLWSVTSGELVRVLPGHHGGIYSIAFSPDGKFLATGGEDKRIKIWDISGGVLISELKGHTDTVVGLSWSPDGEFIASSSLDSTARIWFTKNAFESQESSLQLAPKIYTTNCKSLLSLSYTKNNSPICVGTC